MQEWSRTWLLSLNLEKCKVMHIGKIKHQMQAIKWEILPLRVPLMS